MNLFPREEQRHRSIEQTYGQKGMNGRVGQIEKLVLTYTYAHTHTHTHIYKIDV